MKALKRSVPALAILGGALWEGLFLRECKVGTFTLSFDEGFEVPEDGSP